MVFNSAEELQSYMFSIGNPKNAKFCRRLIPGLEATAGMKTPEVVALAKSIIKDGEADKVLHFTGGHDILGLQGKILVNLKEPFSVKKAYLDELLPRFDSWALVDSSVLTVKPKEAQEIWDYAIACIKTGKEFIVRYGIVTMLANFVNKNERLSAVFEALDQVTYGAYNVDMAAAWLLATAFAKTYGGDVETDATLSYMRCSPALNDFVKKKALQKMRESYRVPDEIKDKLRNL